MTLGLPGRPVSDPTAVSRRRFATRHSPERDVRMARNVHGALRSFGLFQVVLRHQHVSKVFRASDPDCDSRWLVSDVDRRWRGSGDLNEADSGET